MQATATPGERSGVKVLKDSTLALLLTHLITAAAHADALPAAPEDGAEHRPRLAQNDTRIAFNIEAQSLEDALNRFAQQTGLQVLFQSAMVQKQTAPRVTGMLTPTAALQTLLSVSGLRYEFVNARTVTITTPTASQVTTTSRALEINHASTRQYLAQNVAASGQSSAGRTNSSEADLERNPDSSRDRQEIEMVTVVGERELGYSSRKQSSALFGEQDVLDTPFQVSVFPIELLQDQQVRTLFDVSKNDASTGTAAASGGTGFFDTVSVRGFPIQNASGYYREGLVFANNAQMPFENKAAVEIVKGLSALRYGFTAPGGIVNYVLKRPTQQPYRFVDAFGDSNGGYGVHVDVGGQISDDIGIRFNTVAAREDQFVDGVGGERQMISMFMTWTPSDRVLVEADAEYQNRDTTLGQSLRLSNFNSSMSHQQIHEFLDRVDRRAYVGENWTKYPTRTFIGSLRLAYELTPNWKFKLSAQRAEVWRSQTGFYIGANSLMANGDYNVNLWHAPDQNFTPLSVEAAFQGTVQTGPVSHEMVVGAMQLDHPYRYPTSSFVGIGAKNIFDPSIHLNNPNPAVGASVLKESLNQVAVFATDYMRITDRLNLFAGVRYTKPRFQTFFGPNDSRDMLYEETAVTPSGGIVFKPRPNISLYASYAEGMEKGGTAPLGTVNALQTLPSLMSRQYEAGVKAELFDGATLSAAVFEIDKALELIDGSNRYVQDGRQVHRGVEATLAGQLTSGLRLVSSLQYLDARLEKTANRALDGNQPFNVPKFKGSAYASWRLPVEPNLSVNLGAFYSSKRFVDEANTFSIDDYLRLDAGLRYGFAFGNTNATLRLIVENLTDKNYFSGTSFGYLLYGEPRTVRLSLSASY